MFDKKEFIDKCVQDLRDEVDNYVHLYSELEKAMLDAGYKKDEFNIQIERKKKWFGEQL